MLCFKHGAETHDASTKKSQKEKEPFFSSSVWVLLCCTVRYFSRFASGAAEICELLNMLWSQVCVGERQGDKLGRKLAVHLNCPAPPRVNGNLFLLRLHCVQSEKSFNSTFYQRTCFVIQVFGFDNEFCISAPRKCWILQPPHPEPAESLSAGRWKRRAADCLLLFFFCANTWIRHPGMCRMELSTWIRLTFSSSCLDFSEVIAVCSLFIITGLCKDKEWWRTACCIITQQHRPQRRCKWLKLAPRRWVCDSGWWGQGHRVWINTDGKNSSHECCHFRKSSLISKICSMIAFLKKSTLPSRLPGEDVCGGK